MVNVGAGTVGGDACIRTFTVGGFAFARSGLTKSQKSLIARIARQIISGNRAVPPLSRVSTIKIVGFASGTRNLDRHANRRATSVFVELKKQLEDLGATLEDVQKIEFGDPQTTEVPSRSASNPEDRKAMIFEMVSSVEPKPVFTDRDIARAILDIDFDTALTVRKEERFQSRVHRRAVVCISRKITSKIVDGDSIDDNFIVRWRALPTPVWRNFTDELRKRYRRRGRITENDFFSVYNSVVSPIEDIIPRITQALFDVTPHPFGGPSLQEIKAEMDECQAVEPIFRLSANDMSIYSCLRSWTRPALRVCFE